MLSRFFLSPKGKITRSGFLLGHITTLLFLMIVGFTWSLMMNIDFSISTVLSWGSLLIGVLLMIYATLCLYIKRFRDSGVSVWFTLLMFIPYLNFAALLFLLLFPSRKSLTQ